MEKNTDKIAIQSFTVPMSHEQGSERSERASEQVRAAEGASEASSPEQVNERTDEQVAQFPILSCLDPLWPGSRATGMKGEKNGGDGERKEERDNE